MSIASRIEQIEQHLKDDYDVLGLAGTKGTELPIGYTQVDYIESSGTQYIDTGVKTSTNHKVVGEIEFTQLGNSSIYGNYTSSPQFVFEISATNAWEYKDSNSWVTSSTSGGLNTKYMVEFNVTETEQCLKINDISVVSSTHTFSSATSNDNAYLFARNFGSVAQINSKIKLYNFKIYDNGVLIRDYVPCYRNSDNEVGMYDLVNDVFYTNQGTGVFTYGSVVLNRNIQNLKSQWLDRLVYFINNGLDVVWENWEKVTGSGTSLTLNQTINAPMKVDLKGNTSQEVISGETGDEVNDTSIYVDDVNEDKENYITLKGNTYQETTSISGGDQYDSPSPDYPQEIEVVTGSNEVNVVGKNLFDKDNILASTVIRYATGETLTGSSYANWNSSDFIKINSNTNYYLNVTYYSSYYGITYYNSSKTYISGNRLTGGNQSFTTPNNAKYLRFCFDATIDKNTIQLEKGNTATEYEAYKGQTYEVNLGSIELCKIGTYQDRIYKNNGNWYLHKEIGKVVLDGSEYWTLNGSSSDYYEFQATVLPTSAISGFSFPISNYFSNITNNRVVANGSNLLVRVPSSTNITSANEFKTWLSSHNTLVYYMPYTPTDTQITDTTLISQLNALYNATIYSTTHINTETSNLLPYIDLKYNVITASPSPDRASEVEVVKGNNTITISNEDGTKTQTYNITLGNLEFCKIGNYQDYIYYDKSGDKWYKYGAIGKVVLDGSNDEELSITTTANGNEFRYFDYSIKVNSSSSNIMPVFSSHFVQSSPSALWNSLFDGIAIADTSKRILFKLADSSINTLELFKKWLSYHNTTVYYILDTAISIEITDELLISQLNELKKAMSYYDKTLITQVNDDKPFILDATALKQI